jgi:hypothetical protein
MPSASLKSGCQGAMAVLTCGSVSNQRSLSHSSPNLPLKLSVLPFCMGQSGSIMKMANAVSLRPGHE